VGDATAERLLVTVIPEGAEAEANAIRVITALRSNGLSADMAFRGNSKRRFELAAKAKALARVVVTGDRPDINGRINSGISIRANQEHEGGGAVIDQILGALKSAFLVESHLQQSQGSQFDAIIRLSE
jgi:histidyl-tRNA synthetase